MALKARIRAFFFGNSTNNTSVLSTPEKICIGKEIWPGCQITTCDGNLHPEEFDDFFQYLDEEFAVLRQRREMFAARTPESMACLIRDLKQHLELPRHEISSIPANHRFQSFSTAAILRSTELAIRVWLNINICSADISVGPVESLTSTIQWLDGQSLRGLVSSLFPHMDSQLEGIVPRSLTAANLKHTCDVSIVWTSNLADHLSYDRTEKMLTIYQHKIALWHHLQCAKQSEDYPIPIDVLQETIDTINLLFPYHDGAIQTLLNAEGKSFYKMGFCDRPVISELSSYKIWGKRLSDLLNAFNEPPQGFWQMARDRRNFGNWANFWIAVFVALLTVMSIGFGTASTVYAVKQYDLAYKQYRLSLLQTCSISDASEQLRAFCSSEFFR